MFDCFCAMKRSEFLRTLCGGTTAALTGCSTAARPARSSATPWPPVPYKSVRAFVYDCEAEQHNMTFLDKGNRMHKGVINAPGAPLSPAQVKRLVATTNTPATRNKYKPCYVPHHAIVFYDEADHPVANLEICFTCNRHIATPSGTPEIIDYGSLWALMHELNVPAQRGEGYYRQLYRQTKAGA
jgi:hypothetical protein